MKVIEIFDSIQGEGMFLGTPANFIRLAGCNLKCPWCDTDWSSDKAVEMSVDEICEQLSENRLLTVITGGEPFLRPKELEKLVDAILEKYDTVVSIETNGSFPTWELKNKYSAQVWITCSPKPQNKWNVSSGVRCDELKFVIDDDISYGDIAKYFNEWEVPIWLQPEGSQMQKQWKKCYQLAQQAGSKADVRVGVQLHKLMEVR